MTVAELASLVRKQTHTDSTSFTDSEIIEYWKPSQDEIVRKLREYNSEGIDPFLIPHYQDLKEDLREYYFPKTAINRIKRIEAKFESDNDYIKLEPMDLHEVSHATEDEDTITSLYSNVRGDAKYDIQTGGIYIYSGSITDITDGLKVLYEELPIVPSDLTIANEIHDIPRNAVLSVGTSDDTKLAYSVFQYVIDYIGYYKTKGEVALASGTIPADKWGIWRFSIDTNGTITSTAGSSNTSGYADEATAIADLPSTPAGEADMGYITVLTNSGNTFVPGTDALAGGSSGNVAATTNYYQSSNNLNRVFGLPWGLHEVLQIRIGIHYKQNQDKPISLTEREQSWKIELIDAIHGVLGISEDDEILGGVPRPYNDGEDL